MNKIHGMSNKPEYVIWKGINNRCYVATNTAYKYYGARGITVCDRWRYSFLNFYNDMGERPFSNYELDRIKNHLGYSPSNCRWVTKKVNNRKRSYCKLSLEKAKEIREKYHKGATLKTLAEEYNCSLYPIWSVVKGISWT